MSVRIISNPSRGWHWWEIVTDEGKILQLGPVCHSEEEAERGAAKIRSIITTP